jgi:hypothetical protein
MGSGLHENILKWMPILIIAYSVSNFVSYYFTHGAPEESVTWVLAGVCGFSVFFFIFPCKCNCVTSRAGQYKKDENDYQNEVLTFFEDYVRCNPVTSRDGWKQWLAFVEGKKYTEKKGRDEKLTMEQKLRAIIPTENDSVLQYALSDQAGKQAALNPSVLAFQPASSSVLRTFARMSGQGYQPIPEQLENPYVRQFTAK